MAQGKGQRLGAGSWPTARRPTRNRSRLLDRGRAGWGAALLRLLRVWQRPMAATDLRVAAKHQDLVAGGGGVALHKGFRFRLGVRQIWRELQAAQPPRHGASVALTEQNAFLHWWMPQSPSSLVAFLVFQS